MLGGLGTPELIVLVLVILIVAATPLVAIIAFVVFLVRRSKHSSDLSKDAAPPSLEELTRQVGELKKQVDKETKGFTGWVKWLSLLLAFLATFLAVPKACIELRDSVYSRPDTQVTPESYLSMSFDPTSKIIQFGFAFTISNNGKRKDTIKSLAASVLRIDYPSSTPLLILGDNAFQFSEKNGKIPNRFPITEASPREVECQIDSYLSDQNRGSFLVPKSRWQLTVELIGEDDKKHEMKYCFDITEDDIEHVFNSQEIESTKVLNPNCEGELE